MCVCFVYCQTLSTAVADFPEHRPLTQSVESLLADQLQQLGLQTLFELTRKRQEFMYERKCSDKSF